MTRHAILICAAAAAVAFPAAAQRDNRTGEKGVVSTIAGDESEGAHVEEAFKANAPVGVKDNGLPRFAIVGKDHKFYLGIGAQFLGEAVYDFGGSMPGATLFTPSALTAPTPGNDKKLGFGWQSSSVYLNFVALPHSANSVGIFFKANFMGNNNAFNCYHFYGKYRGLTVGYTTSAFTDAAAEPMTIDFEGPNGYPYMTLFTARWEQKFSKHFSGAIGVDAPTTELTTNAKTEQLTQTLPAVPLYVQYAWDGGASHVRLSGIVRPLRYRNLTDSKNTTLVGLGVQLSGMANLVGPLSVQYNAAYGRGISTYIQDDNGLNLDAVPADAAGRLDMVRTLGLTGGLNYTFSPKVSANVVYSHVVNTVANGAMPGASTYRMGDYVAANVIWTINKFVSAGIEYDYGHRKSFDGASLHCNRVQCQFAVTL